MRPLTEKETETLFNKLASYMGSSLKNLIAPLDNSPDADRYVFRMIRDRVYYVRLSVANLATSIARDKLLSIGICLGKFTKTGKFRLHVTALPVLSEHARYKIWVKVRSIPKRVHTHVTMLTRARTQQPNGEMPFLYGGNIVKAHVGRWSEDCPEHQGVIVFSMDDKPLGFGVTARSTAEARRLDPTGVVCFRQSDAGEYLRDEDTLFATG
ncbi:60S ribosome subunit biogenesis protein NIP7 [Colletotrichum chlorophyti]|uniref:60S ribosome subunit biogenesis protein NIP7 n=1 Tax=Colletotrichum chlorophyti TaxID=708187 RepID=A0A1Q8RZZ2_9PEZI|nr:60S ribosome subunit biogenesis protein NIP7 [Colletotrichum chlorophyti]